MIFERLGFKQNLNTHEKYKFLINNHENENENEEISYDIVVNSIVNITNGNNILESLDILIHFTSNPEFEFLEPPQSHFVTILLHLMRQFPKDKDIIFKCLLFIQNIWLFQGTKYQVFVDPEILECIINFCLQKDDEEIVIISLHALECLIRSTMNSISNNFNVNSLEEALLNNDTFTQFMGLIGTTPKVTFRFLNLLQSITLTYQSKILHFIQENGLFLKLLYNSEFENMIIQILYNLSKDPACFDQIFNEDFAREFVKLATNATEPEIVFSAFQVLKQFTVPKYFQYINTPQFWEALLNHIHNFGEFDMIDIFGFIEKILKINNAGPILDSVNFWGILLEFSDNFSFSNKVNLAVLLCIYFNLYIVQNPYLCFGEPDPNNYTVNIAINGGLQLICETVPEILNPFALQTILEVLSNLIIQKNIFLSVINGTSLLNDLWERDEGTTAKDTDDEQIIIQNDISAHINAFISLLVSCSSQSK